MSNLVYNIVILTIFSFISGYMIYNVTQDKEWLAFNFYIIIACIISITLLTLNKYMPFVILSLIFMILAIFFLYFKIDLNASFEKSDSMGSSFFQNLKNNLTNTNLFFWMLFTISAITIVGLIISNRTRYIVTEKESPMGDTGDIGSRGKNGEKIYVKSRYEAVYVHMLEACNKEIFKIDQNQKLNNLFIKEHLKKIAYSVDLKKELLNKVKSTQNDEAFEFKTVVDYLKNDCSSWTKRFLKYNKGLSYLTGMFMNKENWDLLYLNIDQNNNLNKNYDMELEKVSPRWKWGYSCN